MDDSASSRKIHWTVQMRILNQLLKKEKKRFSVARAKKFWNWFAQNHQAFLFLREVEQQERDRLSSLLLQALHEYNEHLFYQIGGVPGSVEMELIISAEGDIDFFPDVEFLLNQAPTIDPWIFIPFNLESQSSLHCSHGTS